MFLTLRVVLSDAERVRRFRDVTQDHHEFPREETDKNCYIRFLSVGTIHVLRLTGHSAAYARIQRRARLLHDREGTQCVVINHNVLNVQHVASQTPDGTPT